MIVEYTPEARRAGRPSTQAEIVRGGVIAAVFGLGSMVPPVAFLLSVPMSELGAAGVVILFVLLVIGEVLAVLGMVVGYRAWQAGIAEATAGNTYAFAVADGRVCLPANGAVPAETWPLDRTEVRVARPEVHETARLELVGAAAQPRAFSLTSLKLSGGEILARIDRERVSPAEVGGPSLEPCHEDIVVRLNPWTQESALSGADDSAQPTINPPPPEMRQVVSRRNRRIAWGCFIGAGLALLLLLAVGALWPTLSVGVIVAWLLGAGALVLIGVACLLLVPVSLVKRRHQERAAQSVLGGEYAFRLSRVGEVEVILFDAGWGLHSDQWPLAATSIHVVTDGEYGIELRCPGKGTRRFSAGALQLSPQTVVALVNGRRGPSPRWLASQP